MDPELHAYLEERFGRLEQRLGGLEERLGGLEGRFEGLEERLGGLEGRFEGLEERLGGLQGCLGGLEERVGRLEERVRQIDLEIAGLRSETNRLGTLLESVQEQVRLVAESHSILYGAIDRHYEEVRAEMRDVRALLRVWNDLVTRRLGDLEQRMREKVGSF